MEDPTNLMMITGVMVFGTPMDFERLKATVEHRLLRFDRFRQRVVQSWGPLGRAYWEDDPHFDLNAHLERLTLPPPGDQAALQEVVSLLMSTQLDFSKPLWQLHLVENYGEGCAIVARLHHCIADGIALVQVLLSLTDAVPDAPWPMAQPKKPGRRGWNPLEPVTRPARSAYRTTARVAGTLLHEGFETLVNPSHALELARLGADSATALAKLVLRWPDPKTLFKGPLGTAKRAAWSAPISLKDVKVIGRVTGSTVNDVLLAAVTGALRSYMQAQGEPVDGVNFRAVVPVNLRPPDAPLELGNQFSLLFLSLPIGIADPLERLRALKRRMDELKGSQEPAVAFGILNAIGMAPERIQDIVVNIFGTKGTGVMTNVPGPTERLYLAGAPLDMLMAWVPQSGRLGLGVSIISYAGQVRVGVATDQGLVPDPETIVTAFHAEFNELLGLAKKEETKPDLKMLAARLDKAMERLDVLLAGAREARSKAEIEKKTAALEPDT